MRHLFTAFGLIALLVAIVIDAPFVSATGGADDPNAQLVRSASKSSGRIAKGTVKQMRSASSDATKKIKVLTKALKNGKKAKALTGIDPLPDGSISPAQLREIFDRFLDCVVEFHGTALGSAEDAYDDIVADSAWQTVHSLTTTTITGPGFGGPEDDVVDTISGGYESANAKFVKAVRKFQAAMRGEEFPFSFLDQSSFVIVGPGSGPPAQSPALGPQFVVTIGDCDGNANAVVYDPRSPVLDPGAPSVNVVSQSTGQSLATLDTVGGDGDVIVLFRKVIDNTNQGGSVVVLTDVSGNRISGFSPISLLPPGPPPEPEPLQLQLDTLTNVTTSTVAFDYTLDKGGKKKQTNLQLVAQAVEAVVDMEAAKVAEFFDDVFKIGRLDSSRFPCGAGPNGFTICPNLPAASPGGRSIAIGLLYGADIPLNDPVNHYQYGFVFDQDGSSGNNYIPIPQFEGDFYRDTDKWYSAEYTPSTGWELKVTDARNGGFVPVSSAARVVIKDNTMFLVVPASEFSVANPAYRTTAFRHTGDFGQNPPHDWSADYDPPPLEALRPLRTR